MQTNTEPLFELIRSLTRSEKRYFKVICSKHVIQGKNNSILLFDYLDQLNVYDSVNVNRFITTNLSSDSIPVIKHRLYEAILNALNQFHLPQTNTGKAQQLVQTIEVLIAKSLISQATKRLKALEQLIAKNGLLEFKPILHKLQRELHLAIRSDLNKTLTVDSLREIVTDNLYLLLMEADNNAPINTNQVQSLFTVFRQFSDLRSNSYRLIQSIYTYLHTYFYDHNHKKELEITLLKFFHDTPVLKKEFTNYYLYFFQKSLFQFNQAEESVKTLLLKELTWLEANPTFSSNNQELIQLAATLIYPLHILEECIYPYLIKSEKWNDLNHLCLLKIVFQQLNRNQQNKAKKTLISSLQIPTQSEQIKFIQDLLLILVHKGDTSDGFCKQKIKNLARLAMKSNLSETYRTISHFLKLNVSTKSQIESTSLLDTLNYNLQSQELPLLLVLLSKEQLYKLLLQFTHRNEQNTIVNYKLVG